MMPVTPSVSLGEPFVRPSAAQPSMVQPFCVVVPFYNEACDICSTLRALAAQTDSAFSLVLVDNGSSDPSVNMVREFLARTPLDAHLIQEPLKGTGVAADSGFRYAIAHGARWVARTDADCLPRRDWVCQLKRALCDDGLDFVAGIIRPRTDEAPISRFGYLVIHLMIRLAAVTGRVRHRGRQFKYPYILAVGNNMALTAELYERAGGFPRTSIDRQHEDLVLAEAVRALTSRGAVRREAVVYNSTRRVRAYGYLNTLRWYRNHGYRGAVVDVR